ncbi:MAG: NotI family restriction endonuclease [Kiritimatiellia bacterium]
MMNTNKSTHPLAEVFGHSPKDFSPKALRYRKNKLCPFNNRVPSCTKDKARDPLGVCSVLYKDNPVITCPVRFREQWLIADDAADFFFGADATWTSLTEVRLSDFYGKSAGNIDIVLVEYDSVGKIIDFGSLEVQAVYISGNVRDPFAFYMQDCAKNANMNWLNQPNYPRPDFLSSSRKRLAPQLMFKGGILNAWNKKMAVALDSSFFNTLPNLIDTSKEDADVAWLVYDLLLSKDEINFELQKTKVVYTKFSEALHTITRPKVGEMSKFINLLQSKVDEKLEAPPINNTIENPFGE